MKTGGKWRKMEECQEKGRKKTTEHEGKSLKTGGKWRKMEECQEKGRKKTKENR